MILSISEAIKMERDYSLWLISTICIVGLLALQAVAMMTHGSRGSIDWILLVTIIGLCLAHLSQNGPDPK